MSTFAGEISSYTDSMGGITWDSIVSGFQKLFAGNPIGDFADDVNAIYTDTKSLNDELRLANPETANRCNPADTVCRSMEAAWYSDAGKRYWQIWQLASLPICKSAVSSL